MSTDAETIFAELQCRHGFAGRSELADVHTEIARDNARLRKRFLREIVVLSAAELAQAAGDRTAPGRWLAEHRAFAMPTDDGDRFPAFQFVDDQPRPVIRDVLAVLPGRRSPWQIAFWFVSSNSWLGGPAPRDHLDDVAGLLKAASHENDEIAG